MPGWILMPRGAAAVRRAAVAELRATLSAIRSAARLLGRAPGGSTWQPLLNAILRATARAERAVARLERLSGRRMPRE